MLASIIAAAAAVSAPGLDIPPASAWQRTPTGAEFAQVYPLRPQRLSQGGEVHLRCRVTREGDVVDCSVTSESPENFGFGDAALKLMPLFQMKAVEAAKRSATGGAFDMRIVFRLTSDAPAPPAK
jgi:protein TonB